MPVTKTPTDDRGSYFFEETDEKGEVKARGFACVIDPDNPSYLVNDEYDLAYEAWERDQFLKSHDPNKIDGRKIKSQVINGRKVENLGLKVNKIGMKTHNRRFK